MSDPIDEMPLFDASPEDIIAYVYDMLKALAALAAREGDTRLAGAIRQVEMTGRGGVIPRH